MQLGEKLFELRKRYGYSQEELADKLNVTRQTVSKWENEQTTPELDKAVQLSKLYGISVDELVDNVTETKEDVTKQNSINKGENCENCNNGRNFGIAFRINEFEYKSKTKVFGIPLVHINCGIPSKENKRVAKGIVAIGNIAIGVFSLGLLSVGLFAMGLLSLGLIVISVLGIGGLAVGAISIGFFAIGGISIGIFGIGGIAVAQYGVGGFVAASRFGIGGAVSSFIAIGEETNGVHVININEFTGPIWETILPWLENAEFEISNFARDFIRFFTNFS